MPCVSVSVCLCVHPLLISFFFIIQNVPIYFIGYKFSYLFLYTYYNNTQYISWNVVRATIIRYLNSWHVTESNSKNIIYLLK